MTGKMRLDNPPAFTRAVSGVPGTNTGHPPDISSKGHDIRMKTFLKRAVPLLVLAGLAAAGVIYWLTEPPSMERSEITLYGNVDIREVALAFNASERIQAVRVEEGQSGRKGELVATLETRHPRNLCGRVDRILCDTWRDDADQRNRSPAGSA